MTRHKGNTLRLRARPYGVKGPKLVQLKDFYRKMGFTDDIAANDTMLQKVARLETLDKQANLYHTLAMIISPHRVADILTNLFTRQRKKFPGLYSTLSRSGIEAGWKGERPGVAAPVLMLSGASPALSGALDYGFGLLAGSQARKNYLKQMKQYGQYLTPRQQQLLVHRLPPVSALTHCGGHRGG